jgi:hypothetical protein
MAVGFSCTLVQVPEQPVQLTHLIILLMQATFLMKAR